MSNVVQLRASTPAPLIPNLGKPSKAYRRWLDRIVSGSNVWTESEIVYFRKAVGSSGLKSQMERNCLRRAFADKSYSGALSISMHHSIKGQQYLLSKSLKLDGTKRKGCKLGDRELSILKRLDHHLIVGLHRPSNLEYFLPIYRAVAANGDAFDYVGAYYDLVEVVG